MIKRVMLIAPAVILLIAISAGSHVARSANPPTGVTPFAFEESLSAYLFRSHILTPAAQTVTDSAPVDGGSWVTFNFGSPSKTLNITLTSPSGQVLSTAAGDAVLSGDPNDPNNPGLNYLFTVEQPAVGTWTYQIEQPGTLTTNRAVILELYSDSSIRSGMVGGGSAFPLGRDIPLGLVTVNSQTPLTSGLTLTATLTKVDDAQFTPVAVTFRDDGAEGDGAAGDGLFSAAVSPTAVGQYFVEAIIGGTTAQGQPFLRSAGAALEVVPNRGALTGAFTDRGIDDNGDGLFDRVGVSPGLSGVESGEYIVSVLLTAGNGARIAANTTQQLAAGATGVEVAFPAEDLRRELRVNGPYTVTQALLQRITPTSVEFADERSNLGSTAAYDLNLLNRPPITLGATITATGIDTNGNGKFDYLDIIIPVNMLFAGSYTWNASLLTDSGDEIGRAANSGALSVGDGALTLRFDGAAIGQKGVDGPYTLDSLFIYGNNQSLIAPQTYTTQAFRASEFEGVNNPPVANAGGPYTHEAGQTLTLDGSGSTDSDGTIVQYEWDFESDGVFEANSSNPTAVYTYSVTVPTTATLRVTDNSGLSATASALVAVKWQESLEWYDGNGTMSGVRRVADYSRDQATCDSDAEFEHVFSFNVPTTVDPARFRWWALNVDIDQQLKALYGSILQGGGLYGSAGAAYICMDDNGTLPGGIDNVRNQLRLSWSATPEWRWQETIEWYDGNGTMSGVQRVESYSRDQATCDSDAGFEHAFLFNIPTTIDPARFRWWALNSDTDQQLKALYGTTLPGRGVYADNRTVTMCMDDLGLLPGGAENVRAQLRLSWGAP